MATEPRGRFTLRASFLDAEPALAVDELADGLWTISDGRYRTVFAESDDGIVAWDTLSTPGRARAYRNAVGREISTIVYSNDHLDRSGWARELAPDAERIAHAWCARVIQLRGAESQLPPTRVFDDREDIGPAELHFPGLTSASGNIATLFPASRVLYAPETILPNAHYSMLPDWHVHACGPSLRKLLELDFDTVVPGRFEVMSRAQFEEGIEFLQAVDDAAQRAFAEGVAVWLFDAIDAYVKNELREAWGHLAGFDDHVGMMAFRLAHHYLTGGWSTEDTPLARPQGT